VLGLNTGKKARLHRILFQHGLRNGTAIFLPYDQGLEHGPRDFFANTVPLQTFWQAGCEGMIGV
jgi:class I fructose-bisphosphate aldolase